MKSPNVSDPRTDRISEMPEYQICAHRSSMSPDSMHTTAIRTLSRARIYTIFSFISVGYTTFRESMISKIAPEFAVQIRTRKHSRKTQIRSLNKNQSNDSPGLSLITTDLVGVKGAPAPMQTSGVSCASRSSAFSIPIRIQYIRDSPHGLADRLSFSQRRDARGG